MQILTAEELRGSVTLEHERCWLHTNTAGEGGQARGGGGGGGGGSGEGRNDERERARYRDRAAERRGLYAASEEGSPQLLDFAGTKISSLLVLTKTKTSELGSEEMRRVPPAAAALAGAGGHA